MNAKHIEQTLGRLGYEILYRKQGWTECLIHGHDESWAGSGADQDGALLDATRKAFPSTAAIATLNHFMQTPLVAVAPAPIETRVVEEPEVIAEEPEPEVIAEEPEPEPEVVAEEPEPEPEVVAEEPEPRTIVAVTHRPTYVDPREEGSAEVAPEPPHRMTRAEGLEIVADIADEIEDEIEEFARMTTIYQRLHAAEWIFRARTIEQELPGDSDVESAVHQIARRVTGLCKTFWPGSVRGLQVFMTPAQSLEGLVRTREIPTRWEASAKIVSDELEELAAEARDAHGWLDFQRCVPEPPDADAVVEEAIHTIEDILGPIMETPDQKHCAKEHVVENMEDLVLAAHLLRWARKETTKPLRWGRAMGALRWASRLVREDGDALRTTLADDHVPTVSWAALLGRDPEVKRKAKAQRDVMNQLPQEDILEEDLMAWLTKAFTVLTNPQIVRLTQPVREMILEFTDIDFADADRNTRSRLRKLQKLIKKGGDTSRVELPLVDDDDEGPTVDQPKSKKRVDPAKVLLESVRSETSGKRILFVGNRDDKRLEQELSKDLACEVTVKSVNKVQDKVIVDMTSASKYDLVLVATSFVGHSTLSVVSRKAKAEGIPCVRVSKGRPAATVRALARAFNLSPQRNGENENSVAAAS